MNKYLVLGLLSLSLGMQAEAPEKYQSLIMLIDSDDANNLNDPMLEDFQQALKEQACPIIVTGGILYNALKSFEHRGIFKEKFEEVKKKQEEIEEHYAMSVVPQKQQEKKELETKKNELQMQLQEAQRKLDEEKQQLLKLPQELTKITNDFECFKTERKQIKEAYVEEALAREDHKYGRLGLNSKKRQVEAIESDWSNGSVGTEFWNKYNALIENKNHKESEIKKNAYKIDRLITWTIRDLEYDIRKLQYKIDDIDLSRDKIEELEKNVSLLPNDNDFQLYEKIRLARAFTHFDSRWIVFRLRGKEVYVFVPKTKEFSDLNLSGLAVTTDKFERVDTLESLTAEVQNRWTDAGRIWETRFFTIGFGYKEKEARPVTADDILACFKFDPKGLFGKWNMYLSGHGSFVASEHQAIYKSEIPVVSDNKWNAAQGWSVGLSTPDFLKLLKFFNENIVANVIFNGTCFSGSFQGDLVSRYSKFLKEGSLQEDMLENVSGGFEYILVKSGVLDTVSFGGFGTLTNFNDSKDYETFFDSLKKPISFFRDHKIDLLREFPGRDTIERMGGQSGSKGFKDRHALAVIPSVLFPQAENFEVLNPENLFFITEHMAQEMDVIEVPTEIRGLLVYPLRVTSLISIMVQDRVPGLVSMFPANGQVRFSKIILLNRNENDKDKTAFEEFLLDGIYHLDSAYDRTFVIDRLGCSVKAGSVLKDFSNERGRVTLYNVVIIKKGREHERGTKGTVYFGVQDSNGSMVYMMGTKDGKDLVPQKFKVIKESEFRKVHQKVCPVKISFLDRAKNLFRFA